MPGVDFQSLRNEITMEDVLNQLGFVPANQTGGQLHGPCPVHGSTSAGSRSLSVNLQTGRYYCHKCQSHGNQLELWAAVECVELLSGQLEILRQLRGLGPGRVVR